MPPVTGDKTAQKNTWGGFDSASIYSGAVAPSLLAAPLAVAAGPDVLLQSGPGRLDQLIPHYGSQHSGTILSVTFYDAGVPTSGGPFPASGTKIIWSSPAYLAGLSGGGGLLSSGQVPVVGVFGVPFNPSACFQSGLCVATKSGQGGFTVTWSPERPNQ